MDIFAYWFVFAIITTIAAGVRGRSVLGWFILGLCFSFFALILVLILPRKLGKDEAIVDGVRTTSATHFRCPDCREMVRRDASICKHCRRELTPQKV